MLLRITLLTLGLLLIGCGNAKFSAVEYQCKIEGNKIVCPDGSELIVNDGTDGADGRDGSDGKDGKDGDDAVLMTSTVVPVGQCVKVARGIYVENIKSGSIFDVYSNDKCQDSLGEYCDNVAPSFGSSGQLGDGKPGSGDVCAADNALVYGEKLNNGDLNIRVLEFN